MMLRIFPYILKHHGSVKYLKCIISTFRHNGKKSNNSSKILAASSPISAPAVSNRTDLCNPCKTAVKISTSDGTTVIPPKTTEDSQVSDSELQQFLKPVAKPDFTSTVQEPADKVPLKDEEAKTVKLVDAVKPSDLEWHKQVTDLQFLPKHYKSLSKIRLTGLVVLTTLAGYGMAPGAMDPTTILFMVVGTGLTSAAANSINQILEVPYDSQMTRTKNRVLTRGLLSPLHAFTFASCCAGLGLSTLYFGTNALTAALGATNLILYTSIYTPLKRCNITNTWLGSVVGAIPPLMGWAACSGSLNSGGLLLGAILYAWQFPHFNALSWNLRSDYSRAGYRMTSVIDPDLCRRTALRYSIVILGLCSVAPLLDLTTWTFAFDSLPLNAYLVYCAWQFYRKGDSASSRKLFRLSLIHLPALMFLMFIGKKYASKDEKRDKDL